MHDLLKWFCIPALLLLFLITSCEEESSPAIGLEDLELRFLSVSIWANLEPIVSPDPRPSLAKATSLYVRTDSSAYRPSRPHPALLGLATIASCPVGLPHLRRDAGGSGRVVAADRGTDGPAAHAAVPLCEDDGCGAVLSGERAINPCGITGKALWHA